MADQIPSKRPYLSLYFECCRVYQRVYREPGGTFYLARCPRCLRQMKIAVGPEGTSTRTFRVG
ncbi:MAG: hypothetical protein OEW12_07900 [Deltaproteobacteria bacterium]|nr:hypothetical protein [Deltaproteobacteria bacterium]